MNLEDKLKLNQPVEETPAADMKPSENTTQAVTQNPDTEQEGGGAEVIPPPPIANEGGNPNETPGEEGTPNEEANEKGYIIAIKKVLKPEIPGIDKMGEDEVLNNLAEYIGSLVQYKKDNIEANKKIVEALNLYPEVGDFLRDVINGVPLEVAISKNLSDVIPGEGDEYYDEAQKARQERIKKRKEADKYLKELNDNIELTKKEIQQFKEENKLSDEEAKQFLADIDQFLADAVKGRLTKNVMSRFYKAMKADTEKTEAVKKAVVDEKNKKIEVMKKTQANKETGDGIPKIKATSKKVVKSEPIDEWSKAIEMTNKRKIL